MPDHDIPEDLIEPLARLDRDLRKAAKELGQRDARYLVNMYYTIQKFRIRTQSQIRKTVEADEPNELLRWVFAQMKTLEADVKRALDSYSTSTSVGEWSRSIPGIGPVLAAGLLAHIPIEKTPTTGKLWAFAGLAPPSVKPWRKGQRRPWNGQLKALCWKIGQAFIKVQNLENDIYGRVYAHRRKLEDERNINGEFSAKATAVLKKTNIDKNTDIYGWYAGYYTLETVLEYRKLAATSSLKAQTFLKEHREPGKGVPMLPPSHILLRSQRYAVKLFLAHWHHVAHCEAFGRPPRKPYILDKEPGLHKFIAPPNYPMK